MRLSICMIVKDEEKNLTGCLKGLKELLDKNIELVIVDTGSQDNTIEIAKKYTKNIFTFEWNNDFSEARNYSISKASNDWIMILDADERITNTYEEFEKVFENVNNDNRNINAIGMLIKNYLPNGGYNIDKQIRIFNRRYAKYKNNVHNQLEFKNKQLIQTTLTIEHFGYADTNMITSKRLRTIKLIKQTLTNEPQNMYMVQQLARAYFAIEDYDNSFKWANIVCEKIFSKELKIKPNGMFFLESLIIAAKSLFEMGIKENIEKYYTTALKIFPKYIDALLLYAELCYDMGKIEKARELLIKYMNYHDHLLKISLKSSIPPCNTFGMKLVALRFLIVILLQSNRINEFKPYLKTYLRIEKDKNRIQNILKYFQ